MCRLGILTYKPLQGVLVMKIQTMGSLVRHTLEVPQAHCDDFQDPFTVEEIDIGLRALANGNSLGRNAFPAELFRCAQPHMPPRAPYSPNTKQGGPLIADIYTIALRKYTIPVETTIKW